MNAADTAPDFLRVTLTLAIYVVLGPLFGAAFALMIIIPAAVAIFGSGMAGAIGHLLLGNPWLPYSYGLLPAAAAGILVVLREASAGPIRLRLACGIGILVGLVAAFFSFGRFPATNPYQLAIFTASTLVAVVCCHLVLVLVRRRARS